MLGGALTPMKVLVEHLASSPTSVHPASLMCLKDGTKLGVRSDAGWRELPLNFSNIWLNDVLAFEGSDKRPGNDFLVVAMEDIFGTASESSTASSASSSTTSSSLRKKKKKRSFHVEKLVLDLIGILTGLLLAIGTVFGVLTGDIWAAVLFFLYLTHWLSSTAISFTNLVTSRLPPNGITPDSTTKYAIYERTGGGSVIFKAQKDALEKWARVTWEFDESIANKSRNTILHWSWVITGTLAAISSIACMVNMAGTLQLGFLAVLIYSSLAEILATQIARDLQAKSTFHGQKFPIIGNQTRSAGIVRATIGIEKEGRLQGLNWIELGLLPKRPAFEGMLALLAKLNGLQRASEQGQGGEKGEAERAVQAEQAILDYEQTTVDDLPPEGLVQRITKEVRIVWYKKEDDDDSENNNDNDNNNDGVLSKAYSGSSSMGMGIRMGKQQV